MTPRPVAQVLALFEAPAAPERGEADGLPWEDAPGLEALASDDAAPLAQGASEEAYARGFAAAGEALEQALDAERQAFAAQLQSERAGWAEAEGARLAEALCAAVASLGAGVAETVARILRPFIGAALRDRAVGELNEAIGLLLRDDQAMIEISGAPDLLAALERRLAGAAAAISWKPNSASDVRVIADETVIQSRIEAWVRRIEAGDEAS